MNSLTISVLSAVLISFGLVASEAASETGTFSWLQLAFPIGWALFLRETYRNFGVSAAAAGVLVPIWAFLAQTQYDKSVRANKASGWNKILLAWVPFAALWVAHLVLKNTESNTGWNVGGLMLLGAGMMYYFGARKHGWRFLLNGTESAPSTQFNVGVVAVGLGWMMLAVGNTPSPPPLTVN